MIKKINKNMSFLVLDDEEIDNHSLLKGPSFTKNGGIAMNVNIKMIPKLR